METTMFITDLNALRSKRVVVDPSDSAIYSIVQGDIKTANRHCQQNILLSDCDWDCKRRPPVYYITPFWNNFDPLSLNITPVSSTPYALE
jgi:hypothetical protein